MLVKIFDKAIKHIFWYKNDAYACMNVFIPSVYFY